MGWEGEGREKIVRVVRFFGEHGDFDATANNVVSAGVTGYT